MMHLDAILSMGGYGAYVWSAYCITLLVFGINIFGIVREKKKVKKRVKQFLARQTTS